MTGSASASSPEQPFRLPSLILNLLPPFAVAALGGRSTVSSIRTWYPTLEKPPFNPPNAIFGPVWSLLYLLMGIASYQIEQAADRTDGTAAPSPDDISGARTIYRLQLALNLIWSWLFFGRRAPGLALIENVLLWVAIILTVVRFRRVSRPAALLLLPYLAWTTFAVALNFEIWRRNR